MTNENDEELKGIAEALTVILERVGENATVSDVLDIIDTHHQLKNIYKKDQEQTHPSLKIIKLDKQNRMLRNGFGLHNGRFFARIDLWWIGIRFTGLSIGFWFLLHFFFLYFFFSI